MKALSDSGEVSKVCHDADLEMFFVDLKACIGDGVLPLVPGLKGGVMNRIEKKEMAPQAAKLFEKEVLELGSDISRKELCDMVDDYIYYQTDGMSRGEAHAIVDITCRLDLKEAEWRSP